MKEDKILEMFFAPERWQYAIAKGVVKDISKGVLYKLTRPEARALMYQRIRDGKYKIMPPHTAQIPKDNGEFRTVYVNEPADRVLLSIANDLLFELMPEMVHPSCRSYQKGIGCGRVVQDISRRMGSSQSEGVLGFKSDLSKYFDSVPVRYIDAAFDRVEQKYGHSALIDVLRDYYHSDLYFTPEGELSSKYQSLKQGCSVASWLADVILYDIDQKLSGLQGEYNRYSDDMLYIGSDYVEAMHILTQELSKMQMTLNPKKVEYLDAQHWFKFLGYSIKGSSISLSSTRIKTFQKEIESRSCCRRGATLTTSVNMINRFLYKGYNGHSWATQVLPIINVEEDIDTFTTFIIDALRATVTGKRRIGGLGYVKHQSVGCIARGRGKNVTTNRHKTPERIPGFPSLGLMRNALLTSRAAYDTLVANL